MTGENLQQFLDLTRIYSFCQSDRRYWVIVNHKKRLFYVLMKFYQYPAWANAIMNHYWFLRHTRVFNLARKRKQYRLIAKEKKRLLTAGVDGETVRLLCRHMANLKNKQAESRWWSAHNKTLQKSLQFSDKGV